MMQPMWSTYCHTYHITHESETHQKKERKKERKIVNFVIVIQIGLPVFFVITQHFFALLKNFF
jgi:hypothetical protein